MGYNNCIPSEFSGPNYYKLTEDIEQSSALPMNV